MNFIDTPKNVIKEEKKNVKGETKLKITAKKEKDFSDWYS